MNIVWQTQSKALHLAMKAGVLPVRSSGGDCYDFAAFMGLSAHHEVEPDSVTVRKNTESLPALARRLLRHNTACDIVIKSPIVLALGKNYPNCVQIGMIHHLDEQQARGSLAYFLYLWLLKRRMRQMDLIVCVSEYWKVVLAKIGCENIEVIYNSFDLNEFVFDKHEVDEFRQRYGIGSGKPLVYVGNATKGKGADEASEALAACGYELISSGPVASSDGHARCLDLNRRDYLLLLRASDVVLTMSTMPEGWNRTAHEAMLCKTPVIGSGSGGMTELLLKGRQEICNDFNCLPDVVETVLHKPVEYGEYGYEYVKQFDTEYFFEKWNHLVNSLGASKSTSSK